MEDVAESESKGRESQSVRRTWVAHTQTERAASGCATLARPSSSRPKFTCATTSFFGVSPLSSPPGCGVPSCDWLAGRFREPPAEERPPDAAVPSKETEAPDGVETTDTRGRRGASRVRFTDAKRKPYARTSKRRARKRRGEHTSG